MDALEFRNFPGKPIYEPEFLLKQVNRLKKDLMSLEKQNSQVKQKNDELRREKDNMSETYAAVAKMKDKALEEFEQESKELRQEVKKLSNILAGLEKERNRNQSVSNELSQKVISLIEENKAAESQLFEEKKRIAELETSSKKKDTVYHAMRSERDKLSQQHAELKKECLVIKQQLENLEQKRKQGEKDLIQQQNINREEVDKVLSLEKENVFLQKSLEKITMRTKDVFLQIKSKENENKNLLKINQKGDHELKQQKKQIGQVILERDLQTKKVSELSLKMSQVEEMLKESEVSMKNKELECQASLKYINELKTKIKSLEREKKVISESLSTMKELQETIVQRDDDFLKLKIKMKAMEEEAQTMNNKHRWRELQETDPDKMELIERVQILQKMAKSKSQEITNKDIKLKKMEEVFKKLEEKLTSEEKTKLSEQKVESKRIIDKKNKQIKTLKAELDIYKMETYELRNSRQLLRMESTELKNEIHDLKQRIQNEGLKNNSCGLSIECGSEVKYSFDRNAPRSEFGNRPSFETDIT